MEAFVAALDRTTVTPVARLRPLQFRRLAPLLSSAAEVWVTAFPFSYRRTANLCCWGPRGIGAKEISTLDPGFGVLLLLVFSSSPYVKIFDSVRWPVGFGILAGFSIPLLCSRWRHRGDDAASRNAASPDAVDHFLSSAVRGHGDSKRSK